MQNAPLGWLTNRSSGHSLRMSCRESENGLVVSWNELSAVATSLAAAVRQHTARAALQHVVVVRRVPAGGRHLDPLGLQRERSSRSSAPKMPFSTARRVSSANRAAVEKSFSLLSFTPLAALLRLGRVLVPPRLSAVSPFDHSRVSRPHLHRRRLPQLELVQQVAALELLERVLHRTGLLARADGGENEREQGREAEEELDSHGRRPNEEGNPTSEDRHPICGW